MVGLVGGRGGEVVAVSVDDSREQGGEVGPPVERDEIGQVQRDEFIHVVKNTVGAAYRRSDLLEQRREVMDAWGQYIT